MIFVLLLTILGLIVLCGIYIYERQNKTRWNKNTRGADVFFYEGGKLTLNKAMGKPPVYDISEIDYIHFSVHFTYKRGCHGYVFFSCLQIFLKNGNKSARLAFNANVPTRKHQNITTQAEIIEKHMAYLQACGIRCECELEPVRWNRWR